MNLEEEIKNSLAKEIAADMDFGIIAEMMIQQGWHKVELLRFKNNDHAVDINCWVDEHIHYKYLKNGRTYVFENHGDAVNFTLKWAN